MISDFNFGHVCGFGFEFEVGILVTYYHQLVLSAFRFTLVLVDATILPANSGYMTSVLNMTKTILNMADLNCAHLQCPIPQSQTQPPALLKHQRFIEDNLLLGGCDVTSRASLHFDKSQCRSTDTRSSMQLFLVVTSNSFAGNQWKDSSVLQRNSIGPVPLIRVADMIGFDSEIRLGASARAEQILDHHICLRFFGSPIQFLLSNATSPVDCISLHFFHLNEPRFQLLVSLELI